MPVLRQITTCTNTATKATVRYGRRASRPLEYKVWACEPHHLWLLRDWPGHAIAAERDIPCGTVADHRTTAAVVRSHFELWLGSITLTHPSDHNGDIAANLRTAHGWMAGDRANRPHALGVHEALPVAVDRAARIAELMAAGLVDDAIGQTQLLAALAAAETIAAAERGL